MTIIKGFYVSPDFCQSVDMECKTCNNKGCLSREKHKLGKIGFVNNENKIKCQSS